MISSCFRTKATTLNKGVAFVCLINVSRHLNSTDISENSLYISFELENLVS